MTVMIGGKDRDYYRLESNSRLLQEAKYNPNIELCVVLADRLYAATDKIVEMESEKRHDRD
jgi:DNA-binding XRE family transcriptional regulator